MAQYCGNDEKGQFVSVNQPEKSDYDYDREVGFEDRQHKPKTESYNESYSDAQGWSGGNAPVVEEGGYWSGEKSSSQNVGNEDRIPQSFAKWESEDTRRAVVEEDGGYASAEKRSSQYVGTEDGIPQSFGKCESEDTRRASVEEEGGYGSNEKCASHDVGHGDRVPQYIEKEDSGYENYSPDDVPYAGADRIPSDSDLGSKPYSEFTGLGKPGGGYDNEDVSCERKNLDDGGISHVQVTEDQPYAKDEKKESVYVPASEEPCGREEGGYVPASEEPRGREERVVGSGYIQAAAKEERDRKQDEGYGVNETSTYKSTTEEDSKESLKEKLEEKLVQGHKKGGEDYVVDGSHKKEGLVEKIKGKLKGKPHVDAESKYEEEEETCHEEEEQEHHVGDEKEGHKKKGIFEKIKEKLSPSSP